MNKQINFLPILAILLLGCSTSTSVQSNAGSQIISREVRSDNQGQSLPIAAQAIIGDQVIDLEVAQTPQQQMLGLMYRDDLDENRGMLFEFDPPQITGFWMKNVNFPLDMIFLHNGKIKAIAANVPPCTTSPCPTYGPQELIDQVIELRGGRAAELGLEVGENVKIESVNSTRF